MTSFLFSTLLLACGAGTLVLDTAEPQETGLEQQDTGSTEDTGEGEDTAEEEGSPFEGSWAGELALRVDGWGEYELCSAPAEYLIDAEGMLSGDMPCIGDGPLGQLEVSFAGQALEDGSLSGEVVVSPLEGPMAGESYEGQFSGQINDRELEMVWETLVDTQWQEVAVLGESQAERLP